ncbi:MAG: hypothetical protein ACKN9T_18680 [Candidatus Methylumidiphilus sp.]
MAGIDSVAWQRLRKKPWGLSVMAAIFKRRYAKAAPMALKFDRKPLGLRSGSE